MLSAAGDGCSGAAMLVDALSVLPPDAVHRAPAAKTAVLIDCAIGSPVERMDREAELFGLVARGRVGPLTWLWRSSACIVVPRREAAEPNFALACGACRERGWPVVIRDTGGTAFPVGPGTAQVSTFRVLDTDECEPIERGYRRLCDPIIGALRDLGVVATLGAVPGSLCDGAHNVRVSGRKIAGTAQRRRRLPAGRSAVLAHAAINIVGLGRGAMAAIKEYYQVLGRNAHFDSALHVALKDCLDEAFHGSDEQWHCWAMHQVAGAYDRVALG